MLEVSNELIGAFESDDAGDLCRIIEKKRRRDLESLKNYLSIDPSVNPQYRKKALYALGRWGDPSVISAIGDLLPHLDETERVTAVDALGRLGTKEAFVVIIQYVNDPSLRVRKFVTQALGRINTLEAKAKLKEIKAKDKAAYIRTLASKYLRS